MSTGKKLGRSLDSLMGDGVQPHVRTTIQAHDTRPVMTGLIFPNEAQPRTAFDPEKMRQLVASIRENGFLEPIVVRAVGEGFEIVVGERRWRAAVELGLEQIPATIRDVPDDKMLELALIENIQREDLNAIERAKAYSRFVTEFKLTQEQAAARLHVDRAVLANTIRLLTLPDDVKDLVASGALAASHARTIVGLPSPEEQSRVARRCVEEGLSARALEALLGKAKAAPSSPRAPKQLPAVLRDLEDRLRRHLGTRATLQLGRGARGKLVIEYCGDEELNRIVDRLGLPQDE